SSCGAERTRQYAHHAPKDEILKVGQRVQGTGIEIAETRSDDVCLRRVGQCEQYCCGDRAAAEPRIHETAPRLCARKYPPSKAMTTPSPWIIRPPAVQRVSVPIAMPQRCSNPVATTKPTP